MKKSCDFKGLSTEFKTDFCIKTAGKQSVKGASNNYFASRFSEFFIDDESFCCTIGIMQENLKKYMKNSVNPTGTNEINNLTSLKFFSIATAIQKNLCLASCSSHLFLERKELLEVPFSHFKNGTDEF